MVKQTRLGEGANLGLGLRMLHGIDHDTIFLGRNEHFHDTGIRMGRPMVDPNSEMSSAGQEDGNSNSKSAKPQCAC